MISRFPAALALSAALILGILPPARLLAAPLTVDVASPAPAETGYFHLGSHRNPAGHEISLNSRSLLLDGQPWFPVMGEFHYSRVPAAEWRTELQKMKAGGVDIVATYVFWIHHEEVEGQWDWTGRRDLHQFLAICQQLGLKVLVRCGPWCHGEVRNGGFPDWVVAHKDWNLRSTDTNFLAAVQTLYTQIAAQLHGELWKDGGPVIGIQVDNEYGRSPAYLMALKKMAIAAGIDVPFYTKTGWPAMHTPPPLGELIPLFGAYADGFWERTLQPMAGANWLKFTFRATRTDTGVGNDTLGNRKSGDTAGTDKYPYLTCEIGGGMPASYHRRMNYDPRDVEAVALCQLGSGSSLMGYYMYHGGQNPEGRLTTLQESQATGYPNDLPERNYDFNAPIGEYGQLHPQYFWLRRLHYFLHDFGAGLAPLPLSLPAVTPANHADTNELRWAVRSDGQSGYIFVNNYQRLTTLPDHPDVQFQLNLPGGALTLPAQPITIPSGSFFLLPFNLNLHGVRLRYATAQPICVTTNRSSDTVYFAAIPGIPAEFVFDPATVKPARAAYNRAKPARTTAFTVRNAAGRKIHFVLLSEADSLALEKSADGRSVSFAVTPHTVFQPVTTTLLKAAGPARIVPLGLGRTPVAVAPTDREFTNAAVWRLDLPRHLDLARDPILRILYTGDVARLTLNGRLLDDDFYSGRPFEIGLQRYGPEILTGDLQLEILPLRQDAPIYFEPGQRPDFGTNASMLRLEAVQLLREDAR